MQDCRAALLYVVKVLEGRGAQLGEFVSIRSVSSFIVLSPSNVPGRTLTIPRTAGGLCEMSDMHVVLSKSGDAT